MSKKIALTQKSLLKEYELQGWWPLLSLHSSSGKNPTKTGSLNGYHPGDYSYPKTENERFEIICGAILTQNTAWPSVEKALIALKEKDILSPKAITSTPKEEIGKAIRPAGYFNQKAERLKLIAEFFTGLNGRIPKRSELLKLNGVGPETADSILLYAYSQPEFVVDAYTKRIYSRLGAIKSEASYDEIKEISQKELTRNTKILQEAHALLVEHAKRHCKKKNPSCTECPLLDLCEKKGVRLS